MKARKLTQIIAHLSSCLKLKCRNPQRKVQHPEVPTVKAGLVAVDLLRRLFFGAGLPDLTRGVGEGNWLLDTVEEIT